MYTIYGRLVDDFLKSEKITETRVLETVSFWTVEYGWKVEVTKLDKINT